MVVTAQNSIFVNVVAFFMIRMVKFKLQCYSTIEAQHSVWDENPVKCDESLFMRYAVSFYDPGQLFHHIFIGSQHI